MLGHFKNLLHDDNANPLSSQNTAVGDLDFKITSEELKLACTLSNGTLLKVFVHS